jgi:hypothetical protein
MPSGQRLILLFILDALVDNVPVYPPQIASQTQQTRSSRCNKQVLDGISPIDYDKCIIAGLEV